MSISPHVHTPCGQIMFHISHEDSGGSVGDLPLTDSQQNLEEGIVLTFPREAGADQHLHEQVMIAYNIQEPKPLGLSKLGADEQKPEDLEEQMIVGDRMGEPKAVGLSKLGIDEQTSEERVT